jgi:hypothetical protein
LWWKNQLALGLRPIGRGICLEIAKIPRSKDLCIPPFQHEMRAAPAWAGAYVR